jgi:hypothetical protein
MIITGDITPLLAAFASLILGPFYFYLASIPCEYQDYARHFEFKGIIFFHLHAEDLSLSGNETDLHLFC